MEMFHLPLEAGQTPHARPGRRNRSLALYSSRVDRSVLIRADSEGAGHDFLDVSRGTEPFRIPATGLSESHLASLSRFERYITDSVLPDGTPISLARPPSGLQDDEDSDGDEVGGCDCEVGEARGSICTRADGASCECVGDFGNFYSDTLEAPGGLLEQLLNLDALPERWPLVECSPDCLCARACGNRLTQGGVRVPLTVRPVPYAGLGLFYSPSTSCDLPRGSFVSLYAGEYLTTSQARSRWSSAVKAEEGEGNYILTLREPGLVLHIDPRRYGNIGRFLNHSCYSNCVIQVVRWGAGSWPRAAIFTKRAVAPDEELTFDYGNASGSGVSTADGHKGDRGSEVADDVAGERRTRCFCGSERCRGWMPFDETL